MAKRKKKQHYPIKIIKLNNGEILISQYYDNNDNTILLKEPLQMINVPKIDDEGMIVDSKFGLRDWLEGSVQYEYVINKSHVLMITDCQLVLQMIYLQAIKSMNQKDRKDNQQNNVTYSDTADENVDFDVESKRIIPNNMKKGFSSLTGGIPDIEKFKPGEDEFDGGWNDIPPHYNPRP